MKKKKLTALTLATVMGSSTVLNGVPLLVQAQENENQIIHHISTGDEKQTKEIYVETLAKPGGIGSKDSPFNDFKDAYRLAQNGDTIVLVNTVTIQNGETDDINEMVPFVFDKDIKIRGNNDRSILFSRVPIQLANNLSLDNINLSTDEIYLNGFKLDMNMVKNDKKNNRRPVLYGALSSKVAAKNIKYGNKSTLNITGWVGDPFEFSSIYAGAKIGKSSLPVEIKLNKGVKVLNAIDASGLTDPVSEQVDFYIGSVNVKRFENNKYSWNTNLYFNEYVETNGPSIQAYKNVTLENSKIHFSEEKQFYGVSGKLQLKGNTVLDTSKNGSFSANELDASGKSTIILKKDKTRINVRGLFTGELELKTAGSADASTSGPATVEWTYMNADINSTGKIYFNPHFSQKNLILKEFIGVTKYWKVIVDPMINPIDKFELLEDNKIDLIDESKYIKVKITDKNGNKLEYLDDYKFELFNNEKELIDDSRIYIDYDFMRKALYIAIMDHKLPVGSYNLHVTETASNKEFDITLEFYRSKPISTYQVKFHPNQGTGNMKAQKFDYAHKQQLSPNEFTRIGYRFEGWATTPDGAVKYRDLQFVNNLTEEDNGVVNLYAKWKANRYEIVFKPNGGIGKVDNLTLDYDQNSPLRKNTFTRNGYTFKGWSTTPYGKVEYQDEKVIKNLTSKHDQLISLYAQWEANPYEIRFHANNGNGKMDNLLMHYDDLKELSTNTYKRKGYTFKGWSKSIDGDVIYKDKEVVSNLTDKSGDMIHLYAQWVVNSYIIEFNANDGTGNMNQLSMNYDVSKKLSNNVFTREGYTFKGWSTSPNGEVIYTDGKEVKNLTDQASGKVVLYAVWEKNETENNSNLKIEVTEKELEVGDTFDPLNAIVVYDENNKRVVLDHSNIIENTVNPKVAGTYHITYKLTDNNGVTVTKTIQVKVKEKEQPIVPETPNESTKPNNPTEPNKPNEEIKPNNGVQPIKTGDVSSVGMLSSMLASSSGLLAILLRKKRKK